MKGYKGVHVQGTQVGGDSLEMTVLFDGHYISFFGTKNEMMGLAEDMLAEIIEHLDVIQEIHGSYKKVRK